MLSSGTGTSQKSFVQCDDARSRPDYETVNGREDDHQAVPAEASIFAILPNFSGVARFKDMLDSSVFGWAQYAANKPIEDRFHVERLQNRGWWFSVFDGHGGWQCSDYAHKILHKNFELELNNHLGYFPEKKDNFFSSSAGVGSAASLDNEDLQAFYQGNISSKIITQALKAAFERTDRQYMAKVVGAFELGFGRDTRAGSCALSVFVLDGVLFCANAGDSRAIIISSKSRPNVSQLSTNTAVELPSDSLAPEDFASSYAPDSPRQIMDSIESIQKRIRSQALLDEELQQVALNKSIGFQPDPRSDEALRKALLKKLFEVSVSIPVAELAETTEVLERSVAVKKSVVEGKAEAPGPVTKIFSYLTGRNRGALKQSSLQTADPRSEPVSLVSSMAHTEDRYRSETPFVATIYENDLGARVEYVNHSNKVSDSLDIKEWIEVSRMSNEHNAKIKREQEKLKAEHPNEPDVIMCKSKNSCYVKGMSTSLFCILCSEVNCSGRLQPTRSLGDFHLKHSEFQVPKKTSKSSQKREVSVVLYFSSVQAFCLIHICL